MIEIMEKKTKHKDIKMIQRTIIFKRVCLYKSNFSFDIIVTILDILNFKFFMSNDNYLLYI